MRNQIVGKFKLGLTPFLNDWWNITCFLTARVLSTSMIPFGQRVFQVDFDFIEHRLTIQVSDGRSQKIALTERSVAEFYQELMTHFASLDIQVRINTHPVEVDDGIPFEADNVHASYDPVFVNRWWRMLVGVSRVMERYRTGFEGKSSPVQFFWGSFDLATTRYSGRLAPPREWPTRWMALGAPHEQALAGFWPGNERLPDPAVVPDTYPEPPGCRAAGIQPDAAYFHPDMARFILPS